MRTLFQVFVITIPESKLHVNSVESIICSHRNLITEYSILKHTSDNVDFHFHIYIKTNKLVKYSFFIYLFHEPVFNIIKKLGLKILGISNSSLIILYFVNPLIMAVLSVSVAWALKKYLPKIYSIVVGGR